MLFFKLRAQKFTLVGSVAPSKDKFKMAIDIVAEGTGKSILKDVQERDVVLPANNEGKNFNFIIEILNTVFPKAGYYLVRIVIDGETVSDQKLLLLQTTENKSLN